jgi:ribosomal protein L31E
MNIHFDEETDTMTITLREARIQESDENSQFIVEAVREKLARQKRANLEAIRIEGYQATRAEDRIITEDFELIIGDGV